MLRNSCNLNLFRQNQQLWLKSAFSAQPAAVMKYEDAKPTSQIPTLSVLRLLRAFLPGGFLYKASFADLNTRLHKKYGNIFLMPGMFGKPEIALIFDPNDFETLLRTEGIWPNRRGLETLEYYRLKIRPDIYSEVGGLFNEQGEKWQKMRTTVNPIMMQPKAMKLYIPQVEAISNEFLTMITAKRDAKNEVPGNFGEFVNLWSLESIACITLDKRLGLVSGDEKKQDKDAKELIKNIRQLFELTYEFEIQPSIWKYYKTQSFVNLMKVFDSMTEITLRYVNEAVAKFEKNPTVDENDQSILEKLLKINKNIAVVMAVDALFAGVDTTAASVISTLYCLAKNPDKQEKLREELIKILPEKDSPLTVENMKNLPYLRACIKESLRIYPAVVGSVRKTGQDIVLQGYQVPKGIDVAMGSMQVSSMEENYPKAKSFIPERWQKAADHTECPYAKTANPFTYLPFGFGSRMCVGRRLAELEMEILIIRMIRQYKIEWHHADMKIKSIMVNVPEGDLKFRITEL